MGLRNSPLATRRRGRARAMLAALAVALTCATSVGLSIGPAAPSAHAVTTSTGIRGTVTGIATRSGVHVDVFGSTGGFVAGTTTGAAGDFAVDTPAGSYRVRFTGPANAPEWYANAAEATASTAVGVTAGTFSTISATLDPTAVVTGRVTGFTGDRSQQVVEVLSTSGTRLPGQFFTMAADGSYRITGLRGGPALVVFAQSASSAQAAQYWRGVAEETGPGGATPVTVPTAGTLSGIDATLAAGGSISGVLLDGNARPVRYAPVLAVPTTTRPWLATRAATTDGAGYFTIRGLTTAAYLVRAYDGLGSVYAGHTTDPTRARVITATRGRGLLIAPVTRGPAPFRDVLGTAAFVADIRWLSQAGISTGWADGTYRPLSPVARDAMAAFMYRLAGSPAYTPPARSPFRDVPTTSAFYREICWLAARGITTGYGDGTFRPAEPVARAAMAAFMYRFAGRPAWSPPAKSPFADVSASAPFYAEITWLYARGISTGWVEASGARTFRPGQAVARDAMAAFMNRLVH